MGEWLVSLVMPGTEFLVWLQSFSNDWLEAFFRFFTLLGNEEFYLVVAPILFWCVNTTIGIRMGLVLMLSSSLNSILKLSLAYPRPYWVDERVTAYAAETSFGLPSGHAQNAASVWGLLAAFARKPALKWALIALLILIGLSRLYLGVHFATDVLLGWALGGLLVWAVLRLEKPLTAWLSRFSLAMLLALALPSLVIYFLTVLPLDFAGWKGLFAPLWLRLLMLLTAAAIALHAWVGMRDIFMDYVRSTGFRLALYLAAIMTLAGSVVWLAAILFDPALRSAA